MPYLMALGALLLLALVFGPQWWIRRVMARHGADRPDLPGTGGDFARHLLDEAKLRDVKVELTGDGDHYDPETRTVRLLPDHHDARSVAAIAVAAHEVSHAIQHARGEPAFARRVELVRQLIWVERLAMGILILAPVLFILVKSPALVAPGRYRAARHPRRRPRGDAAGGVRCKLRQGASGAGGQEIPVRAGSAGGAERVACGCVDLRRGRARHVAQCRALVPDFEVLNR